MKYSEIIKQKLNIEFEGLKRGEKFIEFFFQELNNLKLNRKEPSNLVVYDIIRNKNIDVNISKNEIQDIYKKFVREYFLIKYDWYKKFRISILNTLESKFKIDNNNPNFLEMKTFFYDSLTTSFLLNFNMENVYDYEKISKSMTEMFNATGFDLKQSIDIKNQFFDGFVKDNLIKIEKKSFFNKCKVFSLSDPCISVVFGVTSIFLPNVFSIGDHSIKYNYKFQLDSLVYSLKNFKSFIENFDSFNLYRSFLLAKDLEILTKLDNYSDISSFDFNDFDLKDKKAIIVMYYIKLIVNEFCFQTLVMSCFESYYYSRGVKNILFSSEILELKLYKNINDL